MTETLPRSKRISRELPEQRFRWGEWAPSLTLGEVLSLCTDPRTVLFCLGDMPASSQLAGSVYVPGWKLSTAWLGNATRPHYRYTHDDGRRVTICSGHQWVPEGTSRDDARDAWGRYCAMMRGAFRTRPLPTPAATGREIWLRSIPAEGWPLVDPELADFIRSTSGQGRIEFLPNGPVVADQLVDLDLRLAYGAMARELPVGPAVRHLGEPAGDYWRGRALCSWSAPRGWHHLGILPEKLETGGWAYPKHGNGWVDVAELQVARYHGWTVSVSESIEFVGKGDPLGNWANRLAKLRHQATEKGWELVADMWRHTLIDAIGAFHSRTRQVTRIDHGAAVIPDEAVNVRFEGDQMAWEEDSSSAWAETAAHPEWSSAVWGRARARLLDSAAPGGGRVGALHLPYESILALMTDAIVTTRDPGWPDDGRPGRFQVKHVIDVPPDVHPISTARELLAARRG